MPIRKALFIFMALIASAAFADLDKTVVKTPTGAKIDEYMSRLERLGYSGALLVAKDGDVIVHKAYGWRDAEAKLPYTLDTPATVGSITKQFTAAGILALEEEGKLKTTDLMSKYFPNVPEDKQGITLHMLLTHSAGFPGAIGDDYEQTGREEFIQRAMARKLLFTPGSAYEYSNVGYSLLGAIIEIVTGKPYERYLHDRLFVRAGMEHTGYVIPKWDKSKLAHGVLDGEPWGTNLDRPWAADGPYWHLRANGGILSTPADMYRWSLALDTDKVLSASSRKKLFTPYVKEGPNAPSSYAYGWAIYPLPSGHTLVAHNGGNGIFAADFRRYPDDHITYFIASNVSDRPSTAISRYIGRIATGVPVTLPPKVVTLPAAELHKLEGTYDGVRVTATKEGALVLTPETEAAFLRLSPPANGRERGIGIVTKRSQPIVDAMLKNDFKPLQEAFGDRSLEEITARQAELRKELEAKRGALQSATVIGTRTQREMLATTVRLNFEHGTAYLILMWDGPEQLAGMRTAANMPGSVYYPVSATELASFDFPSGESKTIRFVDGKLVTE